jgi:hypothetical protein
MNSIDDITSGAWTRLRNLIGALDRVDRLETSSEFDGWLNALAQDDNALAATIREFLLRALHLASDALNAQLLAFLSANGASTLGALMQVTRLTRVELTERVNELARAGLTVQVLDGDSIEATPLARGILALLNDIVAIIKEQARHDSLINPSVKLPNVPKMPHMPNR